MTVSLASVAMAMLVASASAQTWIRLRSCTTDGLDGWAMPVRLTSPSPPSPCLPVCSADAFHREPRDSCYATHSHTTDRGVAGVAMCYIGGPSPTSGVYGLCGMQCYCVKTCLQC